MLDAAIVARAYLGTWNAAADERRLSDLLATHWASDASYVDPLMRGEGAAQIGGLVRAVRERFPAFRFRLRGTPDGYGEVVRLAWSLGPEGGEPAPIEGSDVVLLRRERIASVIGFIDRAPTAPPSAQS